MGIFLDTSNLDEIKKYVAMGIVRGVTTNPSILVKEGLKPDEIQKRTVTIAKLIAPYPLSVEVLSNDFSEMKKQAVDFSKWAAVSSMVLA